MYVIIVGAGEVGSYVADRLSREGVDVAVVESDPRHVREIEEELDVLSVVGNGTHPAVLRLAGLDRADLLVAVTDSDEVNMLASLVAMQAGVPRRIVRIQAPELRGPEARPLLDLIGADLVIDPDAEAARDILELIQHPGATEVEVLAGGEVLVLGARLAETSPIVGRSLLEIAQAHEPSWEFLFGTVTRDGVALIPRGHLTLQSGDRVRVLCRRQAKRDLMDLLGLERRALRSVLLLGGGRTAQLVAEPLARQGIEVVIVEGDADRARQLSEELRHVTVLHGDITDADVLIDAQVGSFDIVAALTGHDHANVLACLFAKSQGVGEALTIAHRLELLDLLSQSGIDAALSPRTATANGVLRFVRGGVAAVATFLEGGIEVLELEVAPGSPADGAMVAEMHLPHDVLIGAVVRDGRAEIARGRSTLRARDHVVVFMVPEGVDEVRRLFA